MNKIMMIICLLISLLLSACTDDTEGGTQHITANNLILDASHGEGGAAWGLPDCGACHSMQVIHQNTDSIIRDLVIEKGFTSCTGCHGSNGVVDGEPRQCVICHNNIDIPENPIWQGQHGHVFSVGVVADVSNEQCVLCHDASDMDGVFEINTDLKKYPNAMQNIMPYTSESEFCLRCHNRDHQQAGFEMFGAYDDPLIAAEDAFNFIDQHGLSDGSGTRTYAGLRLAYNYQSVVDCSDCHSMHATDNEKLIIDSSNKGAAQLDTLLLNPPYAVNVVNGDYSQLCVLCHQMQTILDDGALDTGNGLSGVHEVGSDCRDCHTHGEAVQAGL